MRGKSSEFHEQEEAGNYILVGVITSYTEKKVKSVYETHCYQKVGQAGTVRRESEIGTTYSIPPHLSLVLHQLKSSASPHHLCILTKR